MGKRRNVYKILDGRPEGKRPIGIPRRRWEDNLQMDCKEIPCGLDSSGSGYGPVAGSCELYNESSSSIKYGLLAY
jgi:hypothetical protein